MRRFLPALLAVSLVVGSAFAATDTVTVIVKKTSIRKDRQFYAASLGEANFKDKLTVLAREKDWIKVAAGDVTGWVHASAVTGKKLSASSKGTAPAGFEEGDVALASKGFNPKTEAAYKKKDPEANYAAVDRMEKLGASETAMSEFIKDGNLQSRGGAE